MLIWLMIVVGWCTLAGPAGCATGDDRDAGAPDARVVAFYRLRSIDGHPLPITLRFVSPMQGLNLSSGSLTLQADGRFTGRYRLYSALPGVGAPPATVTDLEDGGRYRRSRGRLVLESRTRRRSIVLDVKEGDAVLHGPLVGGRHPDTDTLGVARYERDSIPHQQRVAPRRATR